MQAPEPKAFTMNRAERRRLGRLDRRHGGGGESVDQAEPVAAGITPDAAKVRTLHRADMARARHFREMIDRKHEAGGGAAGHTEALSMMVGCFAYLVQHYDIETAVKKMGGALSDMAGQALVKRATDIREGRREPFKPGQLR